MNGLVVVNYNDYKNTINFIKKVANYKVIDYIVIVDNCSTDKSISHIKKIASDKVHLIKNNSNKGYGSGINLGAKYLKEKFNIKNVIISNTDIIINNEDNLTKMINYLDDNTIALVGPTIKEKNQLNRGWKIPKVTTDICLNIPILNKIILKRKLQYNQEHYKNKFSYVEVISGCFMITKIEILEKIGYFDENVFLYYEENIIAHKLKNLNLKTIVINDIFIIHNHSVTIDNALGRINKFKILKKSQKFFHKNYSKASIFGIIGLDITSKATLLILYLIKLLKGGKR